MDSFLKPVMNDLTQNGRRFSLANLVTAQIEMKRGIDNLGTGLKRLSVRASGAGAAGRRRLSNAPPTPFFIPTMRTTNESTKILNSSITSTTSSNPMNNISRQSSTNLTVQGGVGGGGGGDLLCSSAEALFGKQISLSLHNTSLALGKEKSLSQWSIDDGLKENQVSFLNQIGEAVGESDHLIDFLRKAFRILYFTKLFTLLLLAIAVFHLVVILNGLKNFDNCPREPKIPIYLFVCGWVGLLKCFNLIWYKFRRTSMAASEGDGASDLYNSYDRMGGGNNYNATAAANAAVAHDYSDESKGSFFTDLVLNIFILVWFGLGNYWVLSIYEPNYKPLMYEPNNFCQQKVYFFALMQIAVYYAILGLSLFLIILLTIFTQIPYLITKFQEY